MPRNEYKAINAKDATQLTKELATLAMQGWTPILMSSTYGDGGYLTTVILEHKPGA